MTDTPKSETPAESLARSAFGFTLVALIPAILTWISFLLSPSSPSPTFEKIRWAIIIGSGSFTLLLLLATVQLFRTKPETLHSSSQQLAAVLSKKWLAVGLILILLEVNLIAFALLRNIAPAMTNPAKFLMVCWSLVLVGIVFTVNRHGFSDWLLHTRNLWMSLGLMVAAAGFVGVLAVANNVLLQSIGIEDALRGGLDYRELDFYDDGQSLPSSQEFWQEQARTRVRWSPYTYWVMEEFHGNFINVDANGLRKSPIYPNSPDATTIDVFGGSTVWGEGARDNYTISGHLARLLYDMSLERGDIDTRVHNYGQTGYVSTQDVIWFQLQLMNNNAPDIAIFYQGFNDVLSAWSQDLTGISLQENFRLNDSEAGRILRRGQPVLRLPNQSVTQYDLSLANVDYATPGEIAKRWFENVELVKILAAGYDVDVLFVWQPAIVFKDPLTPTEQGIIERWENEREGLFDLYAEVDAIVRERAADDEQIIILADLFAGNDTTIFHDLVHITEIGNGNVAEALLPEIIPLIEN